MAEAGEGGVSPAPSPAGARARPGSLGEVAVLAAAAIVLLVPRVVALGADPFSGPELTATLWDEGSWAHNARLHALFGHWAMDNRNPSLILTPTYTLALSLVYSVLGVGFAQTRLVSGLAGFLSCLVLYLGLRDRFGRPGALGPAVLMGTSYFMLAWNRVGLPESLQLLLITASFVAVLRSERRAWWAGWAGVLFVLALLTKPSAVAFGVVLAADWALRSWKRRERAELPVPSLARATWFLAAVIFSLLLVTLTLVLPHWGPIAEQLGISLRNAYWEPPWEGRVWLLGWAGLGMTLTDFFTRSVVLLTIVLLLAIGRLGRAVRRPMDSVEVFSWVWLVAGLLFMAMQTIQPGHRFLWLMPPVAILASLGLGDAGLWIPSRASLHGPRRRWTRLIIGGLIGGLLGLFLQAGLFKTVRTFARQLVPGYADWLSPARSASLVWSFTFLAGLLVIPLLCRYLPSSPRRLPSSAFLLLFVLAEPVRFAIDSSSASFTIRDASRELGALTANWPEEDRVLIGGTADAFAMETNLFAVTIRQDERIGVHQNLDAWERFRPTLAIVFRHIGRGVLPAEQEDLVAHQMVPFRTFELLPDGAGRPRYAAWVFASPRLAGVPTH